MRHGVAGADTALVLQQDAGELGGVHETCSPEQNPAALYLANLGSEKSRAGARSALKCIARLLGSTIDAVAWGSLRSPMVLEIRSRMLASGAAASSVNTRLAILGGVLKVAHLLGQISGEDLARIRSMKPLQSKRDPVGRALEASEIDALFGACTPSTKAGARDAAILALLRVTGMRRSELAGLPRSAVDTKTGEIRLIGKGNKERCVYAGDALRALRAWLEARGDHEGPLFVRIDHVDRLGEKALSDGAIALVLARLGRRGGVARFTPHDLRRTMAGDLLERGVDLSTVKALMGHASADTTVKYDRRGPEVRRKAAALLSTPYRGVSNNGQAD